MTLPVNPSEVHIRKTRSLMQDDDTQEGDDVSDGGDIKHILSICLSMYFISANLKGGLYINVKVHFSLLAHIEPGVLRLHLHSDLQLDFN